MSIRVRIAALSDLPIIHNLIRDSFAAMDRHSCLGKALWLRAAEDLITSELSSGAFEATYLDKGVDRCFWVAEMADVGGVIGCVGMKRKTGKHSQDAELVRMAVSPEHRGKGYGAVLVNEVVSHCRNTLPGVERIVLTTGNPDSANFYVKKAGFKDYNYFFFHSCVLVL